MISHPDAGRIIWHIHIDLHKVFDTIDQRWANFLYGRPHWKKMLQTMEIF